MKNAQSSLREWEIKMLWIHEFIKFIAGLWVKVKYLQPKLQNILASAKFVLISKNIGSALQRFSSAQLDSVMFFFIGFSLMITTKCVASL